MKAITIRQPWAYLIINGYMDVHNVQHPFNHFGTLYIHAGSTIDHPEPVYLKSRLPQDVYDIVINCMQAQCLKTGGIIGRVMVKDCFNYSTGRWFRGPWALLLGDPEPLPFLHCKGQLGIWNFHHRMYE